MLGPCPSPPQSRGRSSFNPVEDRESFNEQQAKPNSKVNSFRIADSFRDSREPSKTIVAAEARTKNEEEDHNPVVPIEPEEPTEGDDINISEPNIAPDTKPTVP